jgi:hypothetical protein
MARKFYRLRFGMKQHPESFAERGFRELKAGEVYPGGYKDADEYQLLYAGDVFAVEELLIMRPASMGGWMETPLSDSGEMGADQKFHPDGRRKVGVPCLEIAELVPGATKESWTVRDEPSRVAGFNLSEQALAALEAREEQDSHVLAPLPPAAASAPASVRRGGRAPAAAGA